MSKNFRVSTVVESLIRETARGVTPPTRATRGVAIVMTGRDANAGARDATLTRMPSLNAWVAQAEDETALARPQKPSARTHSAADAAGPSSGASGGPASGVPVAEAPGPAPIVQRMPSFGAWGMEQIMAVAEAGDVEAAASGCPARTAGGTGDDDGDAATTATVAVAAETAGAARRRATVPGRNGGRVGERGVGRVGGRVGGRFGGRAEEAADETTDETTESRRPRGAASSIRAAEKSPRVTVRIVRYHRPRTVRS